MAAELEVGIGVDLSDLNEGLKRATSKFQEFGSKMGSIGSMMSLAITAPLILLSKQMIKLASDSEESTNKVNVAFGKSSDAIKQFASTSLTQFGIAKSEAMDMAATYGDMSTSMGLTQQQAAQLSTSLVALGGDLASFKNIGIDQANTALKGIFTGETESLKMLGIVMTEANLKAYALSKGFKGNYEDLTQGEKVLLRYNYVMANTTNAQGDFARTGGGAANQMRVFQGTLKEIGETFGSLILPYFTKAISYVNGLMKAFIGLDSNVKIAILAIGGIAAVAGPLTFIIGKVIDLGGYLKYLVTPVGLFGVAMAATAYYVIKEWDKVRGFFYDLEVSFFKFKQNLGAGLFAMGLIDAKTAFGDFAEGFSKISRWSETSTDGIKKFTDTIKNGFTNVKGLLDFTGNTGNLGKSGASKVAEEFTDLDEVISKMEFNREMKAMADEMERFRSSAAFKMGDVATVLDAFKQRVKQSELGKALRDSFNDTPLGDILTNSTKNLSTKLQELNERVRLELLNSGASISGSFKEMVTLLKSNIELNVGFISDVLSTGLASVFNKNVKFDFSKMLGSFLSSVGDMFIRMATSMLVALGFANIASGGVLAPQAIAAGKFLAAGIAMKAGGMAISSSSVGGSMGGGNTTTNARNTSPFQGGVGFNGGTVNFEIQGTKLVGVINNTNQSYGG